MKIDLSLIHFMLFITMIGSCSGPNKGDVGAVRSELKRLREDIRALTPQKAPDKVA
jgi:hypothetical protein